MVVLRILGGFRTPRGMLIHPPSDPMALRSGVSSRLTGALVMPSVPMAMPSEMVGVPNIGALSPASSRPASTAWCSLTEN